MVLVPPDLVPKGVLMIAKMSYIAVCLTWTHVGYLLTHYPTNFLHCRIYFGLFPLKYPKIGVSTPGFGPKRGNDRKNIDARFMSMNVGGFSNPSSIKITTFSNLC